MKNTIIVRNSVYRKAEARTSDYTRMSREEWLDYTPPKATPGYRLLYHATDPSSMDSIIQEGLLTSHSKSPPAGSIWATTDHSYGTQRPIVVFQVPQDDPYIEYVATGGRHAIILRDILPKDILEIDPYLGEYGIFLHASEARTGEYAETYYDEILYESFK